MIKDQQHSFTLTPITISLDFSQASLAPSQLVLSDSLTCEAGRNRLIGGAALVLRWSM